MKFFAVFAAVLALAAAAPTTQWTLNELSEAIQNPATPSEMLPYLEHALDNMMEQLFSGNNVGSVIVPTPAGLLPVEAVVEASNPAIVMPVGPVVEEALPVAPVVVAEPSPAIVADASGSPLVQIIVNIKSQEIAAPAEIPEILEPSPVLVPEPVIVAPAPAPVEIAPAPAPVVIAPAPVEVAPAPAPVVIAPAPVVVVPAPQNPIDVIAVSTPEVNPIDLLQPVPVAIAAGETQEGILV